MSYLRRTQKNLVKNNLNDESNGGIERIEVKMYNPNDLFPTNINFIIPPQKKFRNKLNKFSYIPPQYILNKNNMYLNQRPICSCNRNSLNRKNNFINNQIHTIFKNTNICPYCIYEKEMLDGKKSFRTEISNVIYNSNEIDKNEFINPNKTMRNISNDKENQNQNYIINTLPTLKRREIPYDNQKIYIMPYSKEKTNSKKDIISNCNKEHTKIILRNKNEINKKVRSKTDINVIKFIKNNKLIDNNKVNINPNKSLLNNNFFMIEQKTNNFIIDNEFIPPNNVNFNNLNNNLNKTTNVKKETKKEKINSNKSIAHNNSEINNYENINLNPINSNKNKEKSFNLEEANINNNIIKNINLNNKKENNINLNINEREKIFQNNKEKNDENNNDNNDDNNDYIESKENKELINIAIKQEIININENDIHIDKNVNDKLKKSYIKKNKNNEINEKLYLPENKISDEDNILKEKEELNIEENIINHNDIINRSNNKYNKSNENDANINNINKENIIQKENLKQKEKEKDYNDINEKENENKKIDNNYENSQICNKNIAPNNNINELEENKIEKEIIEDNNNNKKLEEDKNENYNFELNQNFKEIEENQNENNIDEKQNMNNYESTNNPKKEFINNLTNQISNTNNNNNIEKEEQIPSTIRQNLEKKINKDEKLFQEKEKNDTEKKSESKSSNKKMLLKSKSLRKSKKSISEKKIKVPLYSELSFNLKKGKKKQIEPLFSKYEQLEGKNKHHYSNSNILTSKPVYKKAMEIFPSQYGIEMPYKSQFRQSDYAINIITSNKSSDKCNKNKTDSNKKKSSKFTKIENNNVNRELFKIKKYTNKNYHMYKNDIKTDNPFIGLSHYDKNNKERKNLISQKIKKEGDEYNNMIAFEENILNKKSLSEDELNQFINILCKFIFENEIKNIDKKESNEFKINKVSNIIKNMKTEEQNKILENLQNNAKDKYSNDIVEKIKNKIKEFKKKITKAYKNKEDSEDGEHDYSSKTNSTNKKILKKSIQ